METIEFRCIYCNKTSKESEIGYLCLIHAPGTYYQCYNPHNGKMCKENKEEILPDGSKQK